MIPLTTTHLVAVFTTPTITKSYKQGCVCTITDELSEPAAENSSFTPVSYTCRRTLYDAAMSVFAYYWFHVLTKTPCF